MSAKLTPDTTPVPEGVETDAPNGTTRRSFVGYVLAGSTLAVTAC